jgi:SAM-dependent methyltransferase
MSKHATGLPGYASPATILTGAKRVGFLELVPAAGRATLDLSCGEGRVARDLAARGHRVTGIDTSPTMIEAAGQADPGRGVRAGGRPVLAVTHPVTNPRRLDGAEPGATYFDRTRFSDEVDRDGMPMLFRGWQYPLGAYTLALEQAGLLIEAPRASRHPQDGSADAVPWHLWIRALRPSGELPRIRAVDVPMPAGPWSSRGSMVNRVTHRCPPS